MSEENRFESEMTRMMNLVINKIGGLDDKVSGLGDKVSGLESKVSGLESKVSGLDDKVSGLENSFSRLEKEVLKNSQKLDVLTAQFGDVTSVVIGDNKRITKLEGDFAELQSNIH